MYKQLNTQHTTTYTLIQTHRKHQSKLNKQSLKRSKQSNQAQTTNQQQ